MVEIAVKLFLDTYGLGHSDSEEFYGETCLPVGMKVLSVLKKRGYISTYGKNKCGFR